MKLPISGTALRSVLLAGVVLAGLSAPALAQTDPPGDFTISGGTTLVSDYRFRGLSLSDEDLALQGSIDVNHSSGFYVGTWASSLAGFGSFGGANLEVDVYAGYSGEFAGGSFDVGALWYIYPGTSGTDYVELYGSVTGALGPVEATLGAAYAPDQKSIGSDDHFYVYGDLSGSVPNTPLSLTAHLGYSDGSLAPGGNYLDWSIGAEYALSSNLTVGVAYVDTDIGSATAFGLDPTRHIADATVVVSLGVSF